MCIVLAESVEQKEWDWLYLLCLLYPKRYEIIRHDFLILTKYWCIIIDSERE